MIRHRLAYLLRLLAWKIDPRPELQEAIAKVLDPVYSTPEAREAGYREMRAKVAAWQGSDDERDHSPLHTPAMVPADASVAEAVDVYSGAPSRREERRSGEPSHSGGPAEQA